jgi:hypothetical protein
MPQGVRQQVVQHLAHPHPVDIDRRQVLGKRHLEGNSLFACQQFKGCCLQVQRQLRRLGQRQLAQVVDQPDQVARLLVKIGDLLLVQLVDVVERRPQVAF